MASSTSSKETRVFDGFTSIEGGMDGGRSPNVIAANQCALALNTTFRGGFASNRPGWKPLNWNFNSDLALQTRATTGLFQGASWYLSQIGNTELVWSVGGRLFKCALNFGNTVSEITPGAGADVNNPNLSKSYFQQAENYLLVTNGYGMPGVDVPVIYNGATSQRAASNQIPASGPMAYGMGRVFYSQGNAWGAGDIVGGPSGTAPNAYRDAVLYVKENTYMAGGGTISVPANAGDITGMRFLANIDTSLGTSDLMITTRRGVFSSTIPNDRASWNSLGPNTSGLPLQRVAIINYGTSSDRSIVLVNSDAYFRSEDGIRSLLYAQRQFGDWGQRPISGEVQNLMDSDNPVFFDYCSGVLFDNRVLMTTGGQNSASGPVWKGMVVIDLSLTNSLREKLNAAWEGLWTGLQILQLVTARVLGVERCFVFCLGTSGDIQIWELSKADDFDNATQPIFWAFDSRALTHGSPLQLKRLETGDWYYTGIRGTVTFNCLFKPDQYECYVPWANWQECAPFEDCGVDPAKCRTIHNYKPQYRKRVSMPQPPDTGDPVTMSLYRDGFEFQTRLEITGPAQIRKYRAQARLLPEPEFGEPSAGVCPTLNT